MPQTDGKVVTESDLQPGGSVEKLAFEYPRAPGVTYRYGTAGFRTDAKVLDSVMLRMGMFAGLIARIEPGMAIGVMVTASHNKEKDNGVKIADFGGGMLRQDLEGLATDVANASCKENDLLEKLWSIIKKFNLNLACASVVFVGEDTRESSPRLAGLVIRGARAVGAKVKEFRPCTTPQLHWCVGAFNNLQKGGIDKYYTVMSKGFTTLCKEFESKVPEALKVDCANGVGAVAIKKLQPLISECLSLSPFNTDTESKGKLNENCGAEHVQKQQKLPEGVATTDTGAYCSLDGDADRIVFFAPEAKSEGGMRLMDGDKIASLIAEVLRDLLQESGITGLKLGVVQTAYANGASTHYLTSKLGSENVLCAKTGVKHLHKMAEKNLDIGVYFEANGHGTVLFSHKARKAASAKSKTLAQAAGVKRLRLFGQLFNQAIGDAISDLLVVVAALRMKGWSLSDWDDIYKDLPSRMLKAKVRDRTLVVTTDAERKCVEPAGLQERINKLVGSSGEFARAFVRPSGTEDVVRIYAEAATQAEADSLADKVKGVVEEMLS